MYGGTFEPFPLRRSERRFNVVDFSEVCSRQASQGTFGSLEETLRI